MRRHAISTMTCLVLLILAAAAQAAFEEREDPGFGDKEILFRVYGLDNIGLGTFDGGLGFRWFLNSNWSLRPGFSFGSSENVREPDSDGDYGRKIEQDLWNVDLVLERHLEPRGRWQSYWGLGVAFGGRSSKTTYTFSDPYEGQTLSTSTEKDNLAVLGAFGVQWSLTEVIRFGAEYQVNFEMSDGEEKRILHERDEEKYETNVASFGASSTSIYAAIAF